MMQIVCIQQNRCEGRPFIWPTLSFTYSLCMLWHQSLHLVASTGQVTTWVTAGTVQMPSFLGRVSTVCAWKAILKPVEPFDRSSTLSSNLSHDSEKISKINAACSFIRKLRDLWTCHKLCIHFWQCVFGKQQSCYNHFCAPWKNTRNVSWNAGT